MLKFYLLLTVVVMMGVPIIADAEPSAKVTQHRSYIDPSGIYHVVGEVTNTGDEPIGFVTIFVDFYDENGEVVASDRVLTRIHVILPGEVVPFDATALGDEVDLIETYELSAVAQVVDEKAQSLVLSEDASHRDGWGMYHIVGKIGNVDRQRTATYTSVVATFYDENGWIIATGRDLTMPLNIRTGEEGEFKITLHRDLADDVASYRLEAESNEFLMSNIASPQLAL